MFGIISILKAERLF